MLYSSASDVYYGLFKSKKTTFMEVYGIQKVRLTEYLNKTPPTTIPDMTKLFSCIIILVHMFTYLKTFNWEVLFHPLYSSDVIPVNDHLFRSIWPV